MGPFKNDISGLHLDIKLKSFDQHNLYRSSERKSSAKGKTSQPFSQRWLFNEDSNCFYILIFFNEEIVVRDDICIKVQSRKSVSTLQTLRFFYWLNAKYLYESVGKVKFVNIEDHLKIDAGQFLINEINALGYKKFDSYVEIN